MKASTSNLNDLPEELSSLILSYVYPPWWLEIAWQHQSDPENEESWTVICGKPELPPRAPLLVSHKFYRLSRNAGLSAFTGLLDVQTCSIKSVLSTRWKPLYPLISTVWMRKLGTAIQEDDLCILPAIRVIELLDSIGLLGLYLNKSAVDVPPSWMPRNMKVFAQRGKYRFVTMIIEKLLEVYERRWESRPQVLLYVSLCGDPCRDRAVEIEERRALLERWNRGEAVFDLVYEFCGASGDGFELLSSKAEVEAETEDGKESENTT